MDIGALLFSLALVLLVAAYILQPLRSTAHANSGRSNRELSALKAERDRVFDSIQEIDMDYTMGKLPDEHYRNQRQALVSEGARILREIDELQPIDEPQTAAESASVKEAELEAAVAKMRNKNNPEPAPVIADPKKDVCPNCREPIYQGDRFCSNCGAALEEQVA